MTPATAVNEFCCECNMYTAEKNHFGECMYICSKTSNGLCEFCYGEYELGVDVYTCCDCGEKTYDYYKKDCRWTYDDAGVILCGDCNTTRLEQEQEE